MGKRWVGRWVACCTKSTLVSEMRQLFVFILPNALNVCYFSPLGISSRASLQRPQLVADLTIRHLGNLGRIRGRFHSCHENEQKVQQGCSRIYVFQKDWNGEESCGEKVAGIAPFGRVILFV